MVLGEDEQVAEATRDDWRDAGLAHLLAVSGQNVMLLAALALPLLILAGAGRLTRLAGLAGLIAVYVPLAGAGPSLQRAGVMGLAGIAAMAASRPASRWYALLLAAAVTLAWNPRAAADPGWQLSFAAVAGISILGVPVQPGAEAGAGGAGAAASGPSRSGRRRAGPQPHGPFRGPPPAPPHSPRRRRRHHRRRHARHRSAARPPLRLRPARGTARQPARTPGRRPRHVARHAQDRTRPALRSAGARADRGRRVGRSERRRRGGVAAGGLPRRPRRALRRHARRPASPSRCGPPGRWSAPTPVSRWLALAATRAAGRLDDQLPRWAIVLARLAARSSQRHWSRCWPARHCWPPSSRSAALGPPDQLTVRFLDVGQGDATLIQHPDGTAVLFDGGPPEARRRPPAAPGGGAAPGARGRHPRLARPPRRPPRRAAPLPGRRAARRRRRHARSVLPCPGAAGRPAARRARARRRAAHAHARRRAACASACCPRRRGRPGRRRRTPTRGRWSRSSAPAASTCCSRPTPRARRCCPLDLPDVDAIKVPHHGSSDPGLPEALERLRPEVAGIEVGLHNTYGHPAPSTLGRAARGPRRDLPHRPRRHHHAHRRTGASCAVETER